jgi:hypothetical protein
MNPFTRFENHLAAEFAATGTLFPDPPLFGPEREAPGNTLFVLWDETHAASTLEEVERLGVDAARRAALLRRERWGSHFAAAVKAETRNATIEPHEWFASLRSYGCNPHPNSVPNPGEWVRWSLSGTGTIEHWVHFGLRASFTIYC